MTRKKRKANQRGNNMSLRRCLPERHCSNAKEVKRPTGMVRKGDNVQQTE